MSKLLGQPPGNPMITIHTDSPAAYLRRCIFLCLSGLLLFCTTATMAFATQIKVGVYSNKPLVFQDQQGVYQGLAIDILRYVAEQEDWKLQFVQGTWPECLQRLEKEEIDLQVAIAVSAERKKLFDFPEQTLITNWGQIFRHPGIDVESFPDLDGKTIALLENDIHTRVFFEVLEKFGLKVNPVYLTSYDAVFEQVQNAMVDVGVVNRLYAMQHEHHFQVETTPILFNPIQVRYATHKGKNAHLLQALDRHLKPLQQNQNSHYYQSLEKLSSHSQTAAVPTWTKPALLIGGGLILLAMAIVLLLKKQVAVKTAELKNVNQLLSNQVSQLQQAEGELQKSEANLLDAQRTAQMGRWELDLHSNLLQWSQTIFEIFEIDPQKFPAGYDAFLKAIHPDDREKVNKAYTDSLIHKKQYHIEHRLLMKDGRIKWVNEICENKYDTDGQALRSIGIVQDITERKTMEQRYQNLVEGTSDLIVLINKAGNLIYTNHMSKKIFGLSPEELIGQGVFQFIHPDDLAKTTVLFEDSLKKQTKQGRIENRQVNRETGAIHDMLWTINFQYDGQGEIVSVIGIARDITERKESEKDRIRLVTAIEQASETIVITDKKASIQYVNPAFEKLTGYSREEALGQNPRVLKSGKHDREFYKKMWTTLLGGETWHGHLTNRKKDGTLFEEEATISPVKNSKGEITNFVAVKRDVSRELLLEKQLQQSIKMEAIGTMASGIAHDFNNILSAIIGYSEFIQQEATKESRIGKNIAEVLTAGKRATDLVRQILTFSRQEASVKQALLPYPIVKEALKMLRATLPATVTIQEDIDPDCGAVMATPTIIHQIVVNLCTNGLHAMAAQKGTLTVGLQCRELTTEDIPPERSIISGPFVVLTVSDDGCGMDQPTLDRIFEPYFSTKEIGRGTGLGLAVIHGAVEDYKGFVEVKSSVGKGSTFSIYLPVTKEPATEAVDVEPMKKSVVMSGNERILVVDDELLLVKINQKRLEDRGYQVTAVTDSREALEIFQGQPDNFDLLITDQTMPDLTGAELTEAMLKIKPSLPVIMCTGHSDIVSEVEALEMGIKKYVFKPLHGDELLDAVQEVLAASKRSPAPHIGSFRPAHI